MALNFANNNSLSAITSLPASISGGGMTLISTQTASSSSTISFTSGIDSTYDEYVFKFYNIHPSASAEIKFNASIDGGSNYNVTKTTTFIEYYHGEDGSNGTLTYNTVYDLAQSTSDAYIISGTSNSNDEAASGTLHLFAPSSTTFVKHFTSTLNTTNSSYTQGGMAAGYFNTTSAINAVIFKMNSGNIDSGVIKLYGIS
tara:strand:+ start:433 stop:1032 length:600 start_codon:yes stop_codon:yes gene_type:complete